MRIVHRSTESDHSEITKNKNTKVVRRFASDFLAFIALQHNMRSEEKERIEEKEKRKRKERREQKERRAIMIGS